MLRMTKPKQLPWKQLTGLQTQYRLLLGVISIGTTIGLMAGIVFGWILPSLNNFMLYTSTADLDKLQIISQDPLGIIQTMAILAIIGLLAPILFVYWLQDKASDFYEYMFRRLNLDIGYEQDTKLKDGSA